MTRISSVLTHTIGVAVLLFGLAQGVPTDDRPSASVTIKVKLFYATSGELSADMLGTDAPPLVNVVAGTDPSTASLVIVAVTSATDDVIASDSHVRLVAQELTPTPGTRNVPRRRLLLDRTVRVGPVGRGGTTHAAFWLADIGCRPVTLQATLSRARQQGQVVARATLPFACGE